MQIPEWRWLDPVDSGDVCELDIPGTAGRQPSRALINVSLSPTSTLLTTTTTNTNIITTTNINIINTTINKFGFIIIFEQDVLNLPAGSIFL